jgi:hypothetical protein
MVRDDKALLVGIISGLALAFSSGWMLGQSGGRASALTADSETGVPGLAAPEAGPEGAAPKMAAVVTDLGAGDWRGNIRHGLHRVQVDGRTFLLAIHGQGVAIVEYQPAAPAEGQD